MTSVEPKTHSSATYNKRMEDAEGEAQKTLVRYSNSAEFKDMLVVADVLQVIYLQHTFFGFLNRAFSYMESVIKNYAKGGITENSWMEQQKEHKQLICKLNKGSLFTLF